jgi:hypothetical protein
MANIKSTLAKQLADAFGKSVSSKNADNAADAIAAVRQRHTETPVANLDDAEKLAEVRQRNTETPVDNLDDAELRKAKLREADLERANKLIESDAGLKEWKELNTLPESQRQKNIPEAQKAAEDLYENKITGQESRKRIKEIFPEPELYTAETMPEMPNVTDTVGSMGKKARRVGIVRVKKPGEQEAFDLEQGERVGARLDIPAYNNYNKWIVSIHDGKIRSGKSKGYAQAIRLTNIEFGSNPKEALNIAKGGNKATIARMFGDYEPEDPYKLYELAKKILQEKNPEWTQIGMNPYRGSYFYDKVTGMPVTKADEVIQIGPLVLAKNVQGLGQKVKPSLSEIKKLFNSSAARTKDGKIRIFNEGGMANQETRSISNDEITKHHFRNLANGTAVRNEDGSVSTVYTRQVDLPNQEGKKVPTLIPSVYDGKILSEKDAVERAVRSGLTYPTAPTHEELREFDKQIHKSMKDIPAEEAASILGGLEPKMNEGGMAKQMEMFDTKEVTSSEVPTEEGGLMDEGGSIDEVSGNDVPVGSLKEEVRDDIPAQLSEGEFVLPADVVRYHGLDKIMRLRDEAKIGLARMEAMGQMGNSEEAVLPDDTPFSLDDLDLEEDAVANDTLEMNVGGLVPQQQPYGVVQPFQVGTPNYATGTYQMPSAFANYQQQFVQPAPVQQPQINTAPIQPLVPTYTQEVPEQRQYNFSELMPRTVDMETKNALGRTTAGNIDYSNSLYSGTRLGDEKKGSSVVGDVAKTAAVGYGLTKLGVDNFIGSGVEKGIAKAGTFLKGLGGKSGTPVITGAMYDEAAKAAAVKAAAVKAAAMPTLNTAGLTIKPAISSVSGMGAGTSMSGMTGSGSGLLSSSAAGSKTLGGKTLGAKLGAAAAPAFAAAVTAFALYKGLFGMESAADRMRKYHKGLDKKRLEDSGFYAYRDAIESFTGMDYGDYIKSITPPRNPYQRATDNLPKTDDGFQEEEMLMNYYKNTARGQKEMSNFYAANPKFFTPTGERVFPEGPLGDMQRAAQEYRQSGGKRGLSPMQIVNQMAKDEKLLDAMENHPEAFKEAIAVGSQSVTEEDVAEIQAATEKNPQA